MKKIVEIAHDILKEKMTEKSIAIDFTAGQGYDTLFLAQHCLKVYAYDIQAEAIKQTTSLLENEKMKNVEIFHKSHELFDEDVSNFDVGMFNLGYLPHGNKTITTQGEIVIHTLEKALSLCATQGRMVIVCYPGFDQGARESEEITQYLKQLPSKQFDVACFTMMNRNKCPFIYVVDKH